MSEKCPIREVDVIPKEVGTFIDQVRVPERCMGCIALAREDPTKVVVTDTFAAGVAYLKEWDGEATDPGSIDTWTETSIAIPDESAVRHALYESGFDIGTHGSSYIGQSYVGGSETYREDITFVCENN